jgi:hypothetical protein
VFTSQPKFPGHLGAEGSNFQVGEYLAFNLYFKASGPNAIKILRMARLLYIEPDGKPETASVVIATFLAQTAEERKTVHQSPRTLMPGQEDFFTAFALTDSKQGRVVTQEDLDNLKSGTEVAFLIAEITYEDGGAVRHLKRCMLLQPPAQPPGIWQYCDSFN